MHSQNPPEHPFDGARLCNDRDYRVFSMLPIFGLGMQSWAGKEPQPQMVVDGMRAVFWYWYNHKLPCCTEGDLADTAMAAAHETALVMFGEEDIANQAQQTLTAEVAPRVQPGGCVAQVAQTGAAQIVPPRPAGPQSTPWETRRP